MEEALLVERLKNNSTQELAFKDLVQTHKERLYWHIRKLVITHENADDVLQNTFIRVYKNLHNFSQQSALYTWMHRIAYNESLRFLEQNKTKYHLSIEDVNKKYLDNLMSDSFFEGNDLQLKLQQVLAELPEKQRIIFNMKYYDDLKFREIADILNAKESTLKTSYYATVKLIETKILNVKIAVDND